MPRSAVLERVEQTEAASRLVVAVAELSDSDPTSLDPLYHTIDPDVLDALFGTDRLDFDPTPNSVSFTYCDCDVRLSGDGTITVSKAGREITKTWR